jgi:putative ABC transport system permease protein
LPQGSGLFALSRWADPKYFGAMGIPILRGRTFDGGKRLDAANEAIISESFASQYFPGEDPLGKHLRVRGQNAVIVGVVGDTDMRSASRHGRCTITRWMPASKMSARL